MSVITEKAEQFLKQHGLKFTAEYKEHSAYFDSDKKDGAERDIWKLTLSRGGRQMSTTFGNSIKESDHGNTAPRPYDLLTCLTKNDPGTFENFCGDFGYDEDSRTAKKTYKAVCKEWAKVFKFFTPAEIEALQDIN